MPTGSDLVYVDSSALLKRVVREPGSKELRQHLLRWPFRVTSKLAVVEVTGRTRTIDPEGMPRAEAVLRSIDLVAVDDDVIDRARHLHLPGLRTLDAVHVATALLVGRRLHHVVTYDGRLADAITAVGLEVVSPGA